MIPMARDRFVELLRGALSSIEVEALELFDRGVPAEGCLKIAMAVHDAKAIGRTKQKPSIVAPGSFPLPS